MAYRIFRLFIPASFIMLLFSYSACKKTEPAEALIYVVDSVGEPIAGAIVVLRNDSVTSPTTGAQAKVYQEDVTDIAGQAYFSFKLEAVLFVEVTYGALFQRDYIRLEQSKQIDKTMVLK